MYIAAMILEEELLAEKGASVPGDGTVWNASSGDPPALAIVSNNDWRFGEEPTTYLGCAMHARSEYASRFGLREMSPLPPLNLVEY